MLLPSGLHSQPCCDGHGGLAPCLAFFSTAYPAQRSAAWQSALHCSFMHLHLGPLDCNAWRCTAEEISQPDSTVPLGLQVLSC